MKKLEEFFLKPFKEGYIVRDPRTLVPLAEEGEWKPKSTYWLRRIRFKDAKEVLSSTKKVEVVEDKKPSKGKDK